MQPVFYSSGQKDKNTRDDIIPFEKNVGEKLETGIPNNGRICVQSVDRSETYTHASFDGVDTKKAGWKPKGAQK